jgi:hypothetical protein
MTRREFFLVTPAAGVVPKASQAPLRVPVRHVLDVRLNSRREQIRSYWSRIWPEAVRNFGWCGIRLENSVTAGEIQRPAFREPVVTGLDRGAVNIALTDRIPPEWDNGRDLSGVTLRYRGYDLCMIALDQAHCHEVPLLSVNTCVHELLHALLRDIAERRPKGLAGEAREVRIDWYATRLWLFHDGAAIRQAAVAYVERLRVAAL